MKNILVYDSTGNRSNAHCNELVALGYSVWHYLNGKIISFPPNTQSCPARYDFIFLHANDHFDVLKNIGPILRYGGGSAIITSGRVPRAVSPGVSALTHAEFQSFLDFVFSNPQKTIDDAIKKVWQDTEPMLALRLLCEAYVIPQDKSGNRSYISTNGSHSMAVECPDPSTWFDLLGAEVPTGDENQKETAFNSFGWLMGDAANDAIELARAIVQPGIDISGPARKFADKVSEITVVQAGGPK